MAPADLLSQLSSNPSSDDPRIPSRHYASAGVRMYLAHYNLKQLPFRNTPDPAFFFETPRHNEALANLLYAVEQRRGFVLLSGEIGSGKTLVTHLLLRRLED